MGRPVDRITLERRWAARPRPYRKGLLLAGIAAMFVTTEAPSVRASEAGTATSTASQPAAESSAASDDADTAPAYGRFPDDALVTTGDFPGSLHIPKLDISVRIGGFVRTDIVHDPDSLGFPDVVNPRTIPLDDSANDGRSQTRLSARNSRINFDLRGSSVFGTVRTFIEADFLGDGSALTSNYSFQLRHAAAQFASFYIGQWWSTFDDVASIPEGASAPLGTPTLRQPGFRWADNFGSQWRVSVGVESPAGDLSSSPDALSADAVPDIVGSLQWKTKYVRVRLAGLLRRLEARDDNVFVGGGNLSGRIQLPFLGQHDNIAFQGQYGSGFARYYLSFAEAGLDGVVTDDGQIEPIGIIAGYVALQHWWSDRWRSTIAASVINLDLPTAAEPAAFDNGQYYAANLYWSPLNRVTFGVDVVYATRETADEQSGSGWRIHGTARIDFWPSEQGD